MLTRRLALTLLAPTVLVSLVLVGACLFSVLYLNHIHVNVAVEFSENRLSHQVSASLEMTTREMLNLLQSDHHDANALHEQIENKERQAHELLAKAKIQANRKDEIVLVKRIADGFRYFEEIEAKRSRNPSDGGVAEDTRLSQVLEQLVLAPCIELRHFNIAQEEASDQQNRRVVNTLRWLLLAVALGAPLGGLLLGYGLARGLYRSMYQLSVRIRDAAGRLHRELGSVTLKEQGEWPGLHQQIQSVVDEIEHTIGQLQQRERGVLRAEQLASVGQIAASVAHELRNPLTSVKMLVQTGMEGMPPSGLGVEDLTIIEHEIRRMENCIQAFLDYGRPPRPERRRADLLIIIRRALTLIERRARQQGVNLVPIWPSESVFLTIDPEQIHQVLVNLLLNALDVLPQGGTIQIQVQPVAASETTSERKQTPTVEVRIRDTGPGIAPRVRERLFEPFVSGKETGLGLGLSICKRLIEEHGGTIHGDNRSEGGAEFVFTLPREAA